MEKRKDWIDALRALAILLVVFGHQVQWWDEFFAFTSPIKVPLFFMISGYLFGAKKNDFRTFIKKITNQLVLPYILLSFIAGLLFLPITGVTAFKDFCSGVFSGTTYWFMPCLIIAEIIFFFVQRLLPNYCIMGGVSILLFFIGDFLVSKSILNFGLANIALEVQLFLLIGYLFRHYEFVIQNVPTWLCVLSIGCYILLCYIGFLYGFTLDFDPHYGTYGFLPFTFLLILFGNFALFAFAPIIGNYPRLLLLIGKNTLLLYLWANLGIAFLFAVFKLCHIQKPNESVLFGILCLIASVLYCITCSSLINKYAPFLVGKKKKTNE